MPFLYVPRSIGALVDQISAMFLGAPRFLADPVYFPDRNIDIEFRSLSEGLLRLRRTLGEERYAALAALSEQARALFEADPDDNNGQTREGLKLLSEMQEILRERPASP